MGHVSHQDFAASRCAKGQINGVDPNTSSLARVSIHADRPPLPSRIPRPIRNTILSTSVANSPEVSTYRNSRYQSHRSTSLADPPKGPITRQKGYLAPTFASSQRQREFKAPNQQPTTSNLNKVRVNLSNKYSLEERIVSKIPIPSKTRVGTPSSRGATFPRVSSSSPSRIPMLHRIPGSPPPKYSERPIPHRQSDIPHLPPSPPESPPRPSHVHPGLEYDLYICPYPPVDSKGPETTMPPLKTLANTRLNPPFISVQRNLYASGAQLVLTHGTSPGKRLRFSKSWFGSRIPSSIEGLDMDLELDGLSRAILEDIFMILDSSPLVRAIALHAYVSN